jgi:CRISPR-associated endonuclease/helicase Cas3
METFGEFFRRVTGRPSYGYQERIATAGLPAVVQAPTGCGKTGIIVAWLWRRLHGPDPDGTPRRLVYALPQRSLVEQVAIQAGEWLAKLGPDPQVALHTVMGGARGTLPRWRMDMDQPAIVVGTVDSLVSKALNRGYGIGRATYPIDYALVTNGAHWVIDEIQLCPESTTTLRQIAAFAAGFGTAEPFGLTCMSATVPEHLLATVDNPAPGPAQRVTIEPQDRTGELAQRLEARRTVRRLGAGAGDYSAIAAEAARLHRPGTLSLVVMNTVDAARKVHAALRGGPVPAMLLHSRFRGRERQALMERLTQEEEMARRREGGPAHARSGGPAADAGRIVVATQVVEAGIDLDAALLVTETAPWPSVVQRAGRCNRAGLTGGAQVCWVPPARPEPYPAADITATAAELDKIEGQAVTGENLLGRAVATTEPQVAVLRRPDLAGLFDTAPDLSGADVDVAPYVRDADDLDVQLAWATWADMDRPPPEEAKAPAAEWRCRVPLPGLAELIRRDGVSIWRFDQAAGRWAPVTRDGPGRARPGEVLVVAARAGGYHPETGFDPGAAGPVPECPELTSLTDVPAGAEDAFRAESGSIAQRDWVPLRRHSEEARDQARGLLGALRPALPDEAAEAVVTAAYLHDVGKAHQTWQDALCKLAPEEKREEIRAGRPWAKSAGRGRLAFAGGTFRHELASLLLLDGPAHELVKEAADVDLVRYLVLAHHGKLRVQVRDPDPAAASGRVLLGLTKGVPERIDPVLGLPATELTPDLDLFALGGDRSWTRTVLGLRDRYGPFVLAYLETVVRIADWRASAPQEN